MNHGGLEALVLSVQALQDRLAQGWGDAQYLRFQETYLKPTIAALWRTHRRWQEVADAAHRFDNVDD